MVFKHRKARRDEKASETRPFDHASGYSDLQGVLGDHTLHDDAEPMVPKGYRARSMGELNPPKARR